MKITRRRFTQGFAATGAALGMSRLASLSARAEAGGSALSASHFGVFKPVVANGRLVGVSPFSGDPRPDAMLQTLPGRNYGPSRIRYPMVRKSFLEHGAAAGGAARGSEPFVRVSWERAYELVAGELTRVKRAHGNNAIYAGSYGWHSVGKLHVPQTLLHRMLNLHGGYVDILGDYSTGASQVIMPHVVGTLEVYEQQTAWPVVLENTDLIVLWGADLLKSNRIGWLPPDHYVDTALQLPLGGRRGAKSIQVISIDPLTTRTAEYLNAEWIAPRPNTDVALMLGIAHTLYTQKLHDQKFLDQYTVGFDRFRAYLLGTQDGTPKSAAWAASISGIDAATITSLAHRFVKGRTMLMSGWGIQRQDHGEQAHWMLVTLASMIGQIGLPGGGFGLSYHYGSGGAPSATNPGLAGISGTPATSGTASGTPWLEHGALAFPVARVTDMLANPGKIIDYNGKKLTYPDIRLVYWAGGNPFHHQEDRNALVQAWRRPETVVVQDFFWTATAKFADIVLPAATELERNDVEQVGDYSGRYVVAMKRAVEPVAEARTDFEIFTGIARKLGFSDAFTEKKTEMQWLRSFYETLRKQSATQQVSLPDFDAFWAAGYVEFPVPQSATQFVRYGKFRTDPDATPLGTPSGKIEIYSSTIAGFNYDDCPPHPTFLEPAEWLGGTLASRFPLHLISPHPEDRLHSQLDNTSLRQSYEVHEREPVWIHPDDALARHVNDGDVVEIYNDRGRTLGGVVVTKRVRRSVVMMREGAWYDPLDPGKPGTLDKHGDVNVVTLDKGTSKLAQGNIANTVLVEVKKFMEPLPQVTAFDAPRSA